MASFEDRVEVTNIGPCSVYSLPAEVSDIVTFRGSFRPCPDLTAGHDLLQALCVSMLDKGTRSRSKSEVAELLENRGAEIHFFSDGVRAGFSGKALRHDVDAVVGLLGEQLMEPAMDEDEFELVRSRSIAAARRAMDRTSDQSETALRRALFAPGHPNYSPTPQESIAFYEDVAPDRIRSYHDVHFGSRDLRIVFVGDVGELGLASCVRSVFGAWADHASDGHYVTGLGQRNDGDSYVEVPGKPNSDVAIGHGLPVRRDDPDFIPLYVANYVLGGNFSARLMTRVRDELGLTYGIRSSLTDVAVEHEGYWDISVTLSVEKLEAGVRETLAELTRFVDDGVTADELEKKKTTITGSFAVGLGTTGGLANSLLTNIERGFGPAYLDRFPQEVRDVTLEQVNAAIGKYLDVERLHIATAGSTRPPAITRQGG